MTKKEKKPFDLIRLLWIALIALAALIAFIFLMPWFIHVWLRFKANQKNQPVRKAYWSYTSAMYFLNQYGFSKNNLSPLQFANQEIDPVFKTDLVAFMQVYLKSKYSQQPLQAWEEKIISLFYSPFEKSIKKSIPYKKRLSGFLNIYRTINYFTKPKA